MNAITLLKQDHKTVEALFKQFETGKKTGAQKKKIVEQIIRELSVHAAIEEQVFYPAVRKAVKKAEDDVLEALEEHHIVKWTLSELSKMTPSDERYDAKVTVLTEAVRHHVKEEEQELFPEVRKKMDAKMLNALGAVMEKAKKVVPTRPHPRAPDSPPGNLLAGIGAALVDKARDALSGKGRKSNGAKAKPRGRAAASSHAN
ncbi:MAG: hypothetical protein NVS3B10_04770 [Polyangiales bacterium]